MLMDEKRVVDPQRINAYSYARNNPLKFIDPDGADPKEPEVVVNKQETHYNVKGNTADEAIKDAAVKGAERHAKGDKLPGETSWKYEFGAQTMYGGTQKGERGGYREQVGTGDVKITVSITVDTPAWDGYDKASPEDKKQWDTYSGDMEDHEKGHVDIAVKGAPDVGRAVQSSAATGVGKTPEAARKDAEQKIKAEQAKNRNAADAEVHQRSINYDSKTQHGKIPRSEIQ
jgi:predicted secreted Zn-dependent protease